MLKEFGNESNVKKNLETSFGGLSTMREELKLFKKKREDVWIYQITSANQNVRTKLCKHT